MERDKKKPGNYLSLDGGDNWISALPVLITLEEIMKRYQGDLNLPEAPLPCKVFDVIIASGHAALVALLVGKMGLTASQATDSYKKLEPVLSVGPTEDKDERERNMEAFKKAFTEVLEEHGFKEDTLMKSKEQNETDAKIIICAQNTFNPPSLYPIRSYLVRGAQPAPCTILQAACASIASPDRFSPVTIGSGHRKITLINAVLNYANPTKVLLREAHRVFGNEGNVSAIVSIGSGRRVVPDGMESTRDGLVGDTMESITSKCEQVHEGVLTLLQKLFVYFRFNHDAIPGDGSSINARLSAYFHQEETSKHLNDAVESMRARQKGGNLLDINVVDKNEVKLRPRPSVVPNFVGREDIIEAMRQRHLGERSNKSHMPAITVLSGLGGSGKTQIALKFADEFEAQCRNVPVYFVNANSEESLKADFETIIRAQGVFYRSKSCEDALAWLAAKERKWCLVLDNADDPSLNIFHYIPKSAHGNVIVTTRNSTNAILAPDDHHAIDGLPIADAVTLILRMAHCEATEENQLLAEAIVKELGSLPLALAHAGGYIFVHQCLTTYLKMYRASRAQFLESNQALPHDYRLSVATTVQMSLDKLPRITRDMVVILSHLEASLIPLQIISKSAERRFSMIAGQIKDETMDPQTIEQAKILMAIFCPDGEWFESDFNTSIQKCLEYSLLQITTRDDDRFFSMHVLVQAYMQSSSAGIQQCQVERLVVRLLGSAITFDNNYKYFAFNRLLLPHLKLIIIDCVTEVGDHFGLGQVLHEQGNAQLSSEHFRVYLRLRRSGLGDEHPETVGAMGNLAASYSDLGRHREALELEVEVLDLRKRLLGDEHPSTVLAMGNLASSYRDLGRHKEAMELKVEVLDLRKRLSGDEHPDTVGAMANLSTSYSDLGRHREALELDVAVLDLQKRVLGDEHPDTVLAMSNLAVSYSGLGRYREALELKVEVLDLRKRLSGDEHPETVRAMANLAASYSDLGRHGEALELRVEVLDLRKRLSEDEHPDTVLAMSNLAASYRRLGRYREALELNVEVLDLRKRLSGDEHPETVHAMANLVASYSDLGRHREALEFGVEVLNLRKRLLGDEHPDAVLAMSNIAMSYRGLGRYREALELGVEVLDMRKRLSGDEHPETVRAMANLVASYSDLGRHGEALELGVEVLDLRKRLLGDEHPDTVGAMANLAGSYSDVGRHREALELGVEVLNLRKRLLGDEHPSTVLAMGNLAGSYSDLGRHREASELGVEVLNLRKQLLGDEHPSTVLAMSNLAVSYSGLGRYREALELKVEVLDLRKRLSGDEHPSTVRAMANLAVSYRDVGRHGEALELGVEVLDLRKRLLGDEHPDTVLAMANLARSYHPLGRYSEALELEEKVLEMHTRLLGEEHPETLLSISNLSVTLYMLGRKEQAIALSQAAVPLQEKALGEDHPWTVRMKKQLDEFLTTSQ